MVQWLGLLPIMVEFEVRFLVGEDHRLGQRTLTWSGGSGDEHFVQEDDGQAGHYLVNVC